MGAYRFKSLFGFRNHCRVVHDLEFGATNWIITNCSKRTNMNERDIAAAKHALILETFDPGAKRDRDRDEDTSQGIEWPAVKKVAVDDEEIDLAEFELQDHSHPQPPAAVDLSSRFSAKPVGSRAIEAFDDDDAAAEDSDDMDTDTVTRKEPGPDLNDEEFQDDEERHKFLWTVYLKDPDQDMNYEVSDLKRLIKKVRFFLHPDYQPYDVVDVTESPFELSQYGWGECPVRLQIYFWDPINKPISIIHMLTLVPENPGKFSKGTERRLTIEISRNTKLHDSDAMPQAKRSEQDSDDTHLASSSSLNRTSQDDRLDESFLKVLDSACRRFPLIRKEGLLERSYPYSTATSFAMYTSWTMGKRKSSEFQRAKLVAEQIRLQTGRIVSVYSVIIWAHKFGYTPRIVVYKPPPKVPIATKNYCALCGVIDCNMCLSSKQSRPEYATLTIYDSSKQPYPQAMPTSHQLPTKEGVPKLRHLAFIPSISEINYICSAVRYMPSALKAHWLPHVPQIRSSQQTILPDTPVFLLAQV
eukprot:jgi/Hompol1/6005/HPOL_004787-RA